MSTATPWTEFSPTGYRLDWTALNSAPLVEIGTEQSHIDTTVGAVLRELLPHRYLIDSGSSSSGLPPRQPCRFEPNRYGGIAIETPLRSFVLHSTQTFFEDVVKVIVQVDRILGEESLDPTFYYYDHDDVTDDDVESFSFFVVNGGRIVLDRVSVFRHHHNGFDPAIFKSIEDISDEVWSSEAAVQSAVVRQWYRRFYQETDAGRLTTFREDVPLYHFVPEWKQLAQVADCTRTIAESTVKIQRLLVGVVGALVVILAFLLFK
jgi:hypothetical protein